MKLKTALRIAITIVILSLAATCAEAWYKQVVVGNIFAHASWMLTVLSLTPLVIVPALTIWSIKRTWQKGWLETFNN